MQFWLGIWYTLIWVGVLALCGVPFAILYLVAQRQRHGRAVTMPAASIPPSGPPVAPPVPAHLPRPVPFAEPPGCVPPPQPQRITAQERRHTLLVGSEGDGKTQTQLAFIVGDVAAGWQVVWASTNLSLYHSRDQQTDLRPIAHLFEHTRDLLTIMAVLQWAAAEVDRRMPFYHADQPHGHPIVIHVDELGGLYRAFGDTLVTAMRTIAEQGRKVDVFLFLVAHNALKESTGLDAALKPLFKTRLLGNVDQQTWTALVGPGIKLRGIPDGQGLWHEPDKRGEVFPVQVTRPSAPFIERLGQRPAPRWRSILTQAEPYRERLGAAIVEEIVGRKPRATPCAAPALPAPVVQPWEPTELHVQVRALIEAAIPEITRLVAREGLSLAKAQEKTQTSQRAIAKRLDLSKNGGNAAKRVGEIIREWEEFGGVQLFGVPVEARSEQLFELEEQPEHLTPAA